MSKRWIFLVLLTFALPAAAEDSAAPDPQLRIFDVRDLAADQAELDALATEFRRAGGEGVTEVRIEADSVLLVTATEAALSRIGDHLADLRRRKSEVISMTIRFLKIPADTDLGLPLDGRARAIDAVRAAALLERASGIERAEMLCGPRVACFPDQPTETVIGRRVSYVESFEIERHKGRVAASPVIGTLNDGFLLKVTPANALDGEAIDLDLDLTLSEVSDPIPVRRKILVTGQEVPVEIQLPQVTEVRIVRAGTVVNGGSLAIRVGSIPFGGLDGMNLLILVEADRMTLPEEGAGK
jgi:hypothetical protein